MSIEETNKIRTPDEPPSSQERIRQLMRHIDDVTELLRSQQDLLRRRGMNLPTGSLEGLKSLRARLEEISKHIVHTQVELRQLRALAETAALITSTLDTNEVLNQVIDTVIQLTGAERGYIVLKNRQTGELDEFRVARGMDKEQLAISPTAGDSGTQRSEFIVSRSIVNEVATTGQPVLTDNASQDERYQQRHSIVGYALRSILAVPLKVRNEVIGVVYCDNRILAGLFQPHDLELLTAFANQAAVAIDNARLFESTRHQLAQITELRDLMNNIFESIVSGVITTDSQGNVTACNSAAQKILGVTVDVMGMPLTDLMPPLEEDFYTTLNQVQSSGRQVIVEVQPEFADGLRYWNINATPLRDSFRRGLGLALVLDDLTENKRREAQLAEVGRYLPTALVKNIRSVSEINVGGQEREITAIFADVRGFTSFSEKLEPETLMRVINQYLSVASDAINLYEGIVDKYMGDAVTGLFNTQLNPQTDHAVRAVRAALSMLYDLYALHETLPEEQRLYYGVGVHTGMAVLGNVGSSSRKEFAALGEAMDISKVLQENAYGSIIISQATYEYVKDDFEVEHVTLEKTKGYPDLVFGYRVIKRRKGTSTGNLFIDPELADLLKDLKD